VRKGAEGSAEVAAPGDQDMRAISEIIERRRVPGMIESKNKTEAIDPKELVARDMDFVRTTVPAITSPAPWRHPTRVSEPRLRAGLPQPGNPGAGLSRQG
jgi:hypothetical protein